MQPMTLTVETIQKLAAILAKLRKTNEMTQSDLYVLKDFLSQLPCAKTIINERFPLDEEFEIEIIDMQEIKPHLQKWVNLFNSLPKNGSTTFPLAGWFNADEDPDFWRRNVIIEASFVPSYVYDKKNDGQNKTIGLNLKTDGTAFFEFDLIEQAREFPELYNFNGSWKEAYLVVVKTLRQGWPQTKFPQEFEALLGK